MRRMKIEGSSECGVLETFPVTQFVNWRGVSTNSGSTRHQRLRFTSSLRKSWSFTVSSLRIQIPAAMYMLNSIPLSTSLTYPRRHLMPGNDPSLRAKSTKGPLQTRHFHPPPILEEDRNGSCSESPNYLPCPRHHNWPTGIEHERTAYLLRFPRHNDQ